MTEELKQKARYFVKEYLQDNLILDEDALVQFATEVTKKLEVQIEKMRNCGNCKYGYCGGSSISIDKDGNRTFHNWNKEKQDYCDVGKNGKYQCWELKGTKEND